MRNLLLLITAGFVLFSCSQKDKDKKQSDKKVEKVAANEYTLTRDGIGAIKIGMSETELAKLLNQKFQFRMVVDSPGYWMDTVKAKYKEMDVSLIFQRLGPNDSTYMELMAVETSSPLCKTEYGVGVGDDRDAIIAPYDDRPISMGPDFEQVNDTTWLPSKTKYSVSISDYDYMVGRDLMFHLVNKKIVSLGASINMGE